MHEHADAIPSDVFKPQQEHVQRRRAVRFLLVPGQINYRRASLDVVEIDEAPEAAVVAAIAVVAHHEQLARRDSNGPEVVARRDRRSIRGSYLPVPVRIVHWRAVEPHDTVLHGDGVACHADHALDEILGAVGRKDEDYDVAAMHRLEMKNILAEREAGDLESKNRIGHAQTEDNLVDEDV